MFGGESISQKKYLRKNNFYYNTNPKIKNPQGEGHMFYGSAKHGHRVKGNIITHGKTFFGKSTYPLSKNPNRESTDKRPSRYSIPYWEKDKYLVKPDKGYWKMSKADRIAIKKTNKKSGK